MHSVAPFCFVCTPRTCATSNNSTKRSFQNLHHLLCTSLISIFFKSPGLKSSIQCGVCFRLLWDTCLYWNNNYQTHTTFFQMCSNMKKIICFSWKNAGVTKFTFKSHYGFIWRMLSWQMWLQSCKLFLVVSCMKKLNANAFCVNGP